MHNDPTAPSRYLAEWYSAHVDDRPIADIALHLRRAMDAMPAESSQPTLLYAVGIPEDAYAFGVFAAASADAVILACQRAGLPADRVSPVVMAP